MAARTGLGWQTCDALTTQEETDARVNGTGTLGIMPVFSSARNDTSFDTLSFNKLVQRSGSTAGFTVTGLLQVNGAITASGALTIGTVGAPSPTILAGMEGVPRTVTSCPRAPFLSMCLSQDLLV